MLNAIFASPPRHRLPDTFAPVWLSMRSNAVQSPSMYKGDACKGRALYTQYCCSSQLTRVGIGTLLTC